MKALKINDETIRKTRKHYQITAKSIEENIKILRNWLNQQRHLPQISADNFLERLLLRNKFRMEQTKRKLDGYYTIRGIYKEFSQPINSHIIPSKEYVVALPLPQLGPNQERIISVKFANADPNIYNLRHVITFFSLIFEILIRNDYALGELFLIDCQGATLEHMKKITITEFAKIARMYQSAYSGRPMGIHFVNTPPFFNVISGMLKIVLSTKLYNKIKIHNDFESLHHSIPKLYLPKDYGGDLATIDELRGEWDEIFEANQQFFDQNYNNVANENLRIGEPIKNENFGTNGTFKTLNLD